MNKEQLFESVYRESRNYELEQGDIEDKLEYFRKKVYDFIENQYPRDKDRAQFLKQEIEINYKNFYIRVRIPVNLYDYTDIWEDIEHLMRVTGREVDEEVDIDFITYRS